MPLLFANPWGLLALLGIPAVLAIHFLHRHRRAIPVSTLFLIEIAREPIQSGRRWHRLVPSIPLWLQLLLVLLLATLLARPYLPQGTLRVAVVIDDSASMRAFRPELIDGLGRLLEESRTRSRTTEWLVLPANPTRPRLYSGNTPEEWIATLADWSPSDSWRDPSPALRLARNQIGPDGLVVYATDTPIDTLPTGTALLSVGNPIENAGVGGISFRQTDDGLHWQAVLVNPSAMAAERQWRLEWNGSHTSPPEPVSIPSRGISTIGGLLPEDAKRLVLRLSTDAFPLDDAYPFVRPSPKPIAMAMLGDDIPEWLPQRMQRSIPRLTTTALVAADFALIGTAGDAPPPVSGVVLSTAGTRKDPFIRDTVAATTHPLVRGLAWAGLSARDVPSTPPAAGDTVLLWAGKRPLVSLRHVRPVPPPDPANATADGEATPAPLVKPGPQLILHFNPELSNFERIPASAILLLRFAESIRSIKAATAWQQLEPGQALAPFLTEAVTNDPMVEFLLADGSIAESQPMSTVIRAPNEPGFLRLLTKQTTFLEAAVAFGDAREGDFTDCLRADTTIGALDQSDNVTRASDDVLPPLLVLSALAALLTLYHFIAIQPPPSRDAPPPASTPEPTP